MSRSRHRRNAKTGKPRRGSIVILAAIMLVVTFGMVAFAVDVGYVTHVDTELQRTADACAMAAIQHLPNQTAAIQVAQQVARQNKGTEGPELDVFDVQFGTWDRDTATFRLTSVNPNAVKVTLERSATRGTPLRLFFAPVIGSSSTDATASAICMYDNSLCGPLVGIEWISVPGDPSTDSFRSSYGTYASQAPRDKGDICSNGPIGLEGGAIVNGNANAGRTYQTTIEGSSVVTGNITPRLRPLNLPNVDASGYAHQNDNASLPGIVKGNSVINPVDSNGNFLLDGNKKYDIPPGTYYFNDFTMTGQSTLNVSGPTDIYITGNLDTAGGFLVNNTRDADNLRIFMQGGAESTAIVTSAVDLYAVVYAPQTAVETRGGAQFFGAVVGRTLLATGGSDIHYDEDLDLSDKLNLPRRVALVQ